jgi:type IV pilus assembly protein PilA
MIAEQVRLYRAGTWIMRHQWNRGFTLIELMIVVAIVAVLSSIAIPQYQAYTVRAKVSEGLTIIGPAKTLVSESFVSQGMTGIDAAAANWNAQDGSAGAGSKYVSSVVVWDSTHPTPGLITITYSLAQVANQQLTLTPSISGSALQPGSTGLVDWACASSSANTANSRSLFFSAPANPVPAQYAPSECQ